MRRVLDSGVAGPVTGGPPRPAATRRAAPPRRRPGRSTPRPGAPGPAAAAWRDAATRTDALHATHVSDWFAVRFFQVVVLLGRLKKCVLNTGRLRCSRCFGGGISDATHTHLKRPRHTLYTAETLSKYHMVNTTEAPYELMSGRQGRQERREPDFLEAERAQARPCAGREQLREPELRAATWREAAGHSGHKKRTKTHSKYHHHHSKHLSPHRAP